METAKIFDFSNGEELNIKVLDGGKRVKLTKSGKIKATKNNNKESRTVYPIKDLKDVERCKEFLRKRADEAPNRYKKSYAKDLMLFCVGCNIGLRVSDLLRLRWSDIFKPGTRQFKEFYVPKEKKTGKTRYTYFNQSFKNAIRDYLKRIPDTDTSGDGFIFTNRKGEQLSDESVNRLMKMLQNYLELSYPLSTHSLRKTFAYHMYIKSGMDLGLVQNLLNHSTSYQTLKYLGIDKEVQKKAYKELNL